MEPQVEAKYLGVFCGIIVPVSIEKQTFSFIETFNFMFLDFYFIHD